MDHFYITNTINRESHEGPRPSMPDFVAIVDRSKPETWNDPSDASWLGLGYGACMTAKADVFSQHDVEDLYKNFIAVFRTV